MLRPTVLTIAGSDSGGGAGIQADLRTVTALGGFGTSVVTCVTAQNLDEVSEVVPIPAAAVRAQLEAVLDGFPVAAIKTGMLYSREIIESVAEAAEADDFPVLVVDPVMVAASGARLLDGDAEIAYLERLLPLADMITPNLDEAGALLARTVDSEKAMAEAAEELGGRFSAAVFLKGGHLPGDPVDFLWTGGDLHCWPAERVRGVSSHGSGCVLSAAIATRMAHGDSVVAACSAARRFLLDSFHQPLELADGKSLLGVPGRD
jgi:hydroxymethylpyrimidine kinase/phosphomethylpyrimidine kinase